MSTNITELHTQEEVELLRWFVKEWSKHNDAPFPYLYEKVMGSLESFHKSGVREEVIQGGFSQVFADDRPWRDGDEGRYRYACRIIWDTHERLMKEERMNAFGTMNLEEFVKELDALEEGEIQP